MIPKEETQCVLDLLKKAPPGPMIEMGVFRGDTLVLILPFASVCYGVDTFEGMPAPTVYDVKDGWNPYPAGRLACSLEVVRARFRRELERNLILVKGLIPEVLGGIPLEGITFAHVDLDQYQSTLSALEWLYPRMAKSGIICCDDYFADRDWLAAGAINEFAKRYQDISGVIGRKAWFVCR